MNIEDKVSREPVKECLSVAVRFAAIEASIGHFREGFTYLRAHYNTLMLNLDELIPSLDSEDHDTREVIRKIGDRRNRLDDYFEDLSDFLDKLDDSNGG